MGFKQRPSGLYLPNSADSSSRRIGDVTFAAKNGMVCLSKELPNGEEEFRQVAPSEFRKRRQAIIEVAKNAREILGPKHERTVFYSRYIDAIDAVLKEAEEQGPFEDVSSRRDRVRRRPKTYVFNSKNNSGE